MRMRVLYACVRRHWWLLMVLVAAALCARPTTVAVRSAAHFSNLAPSALAHLLADFNNHPLLYPHMKSWYVEDEKSNYTSWRYTVQYECGTRCHGRATVSAHDEPLSRRAGAAQPSHGLAVRAHRVHVARTECSHPPLLPVLQFCDEREMEAVVRGDEGTKIGAFYEEEVRVRCAALRAMNGACETFERVHSDQRLQRLRTLIQELPS